MIDTAACVALTARRNEVARFTIAVVGLDLTGVALAMQVRTGRDVPTMLFALETVTSAAAEGLKLESVTFANSVPTSVIKGRINKTTMSDKAKVPYAGAIGSDQVLQYAMTWAIGGDPQVRVYGDLVVRASAYNSDAAPASRSGAAPSPRSTGPSSGSLQFGDQVVQVSIVGVEQVAALVGGAKVEADRAAAQVPLAAAQVVLASSEVEKARRWAEAADAPIAGSRSAKTWAADSAEQASLAGIRARAAALSQASAEVARVQVETVRDNALQTIGTAQASFIGNRDLFETVSSGLAATAPNGYFGVAGGGEVAITIYRKVNGAAVLVNVLASLSAMQRIGQFVPNILATDNSVAINAALGNALVRGALLPPADIRVDHALMLVAAQSGKFVAGAGMGATRLIRTDNIATSDYYDRAGVVVRGGIGCQVRDVSFVAPKQGNKVQAVWFTEGAKFGLCERVEGFNCGYSFWAHDGASFIDFRSIRSINANVHFETTAASDVLFDGMWAGDGEGDNPLGVEAVWHCLYGSKRVTFRNGRHVGKGQPYLIVADTGEGDAGLIDEIRFENLRSKQTEDKIAFLTSRIQSTANIGRVEMIDCDLDCTDGGGIPMQLQIGNVRVRGGRWRSSSQENCAVLAEASLEWTDPDIKVTGTNPTAVGYFFGGAGPTAIRGAGRLETDSPVVYANAGPNVSISPQTVLITPNKIYAPLPGRTVRHVYQENVPLAAGADTIGTGTTQPLAVFEGVTGGLYRLRFGGKLKKTSAAGALRLYVPLGTGPLANVSGALTTEKADGTFQTMLDTSGTGLPFALLPDVPLNGVRGVGIDITFWGQDSGVPITFGSDGVVLLAGAEVSVERLT